MTPEEVQLDYQILLQARGDMAQAPDEYAGFTMAILRMLAFKPAGFAPGAKVPEKKTVESAPTPAPTPAPKPAAAAKPAAVPEIPPEIAHVEVPADMAAPVAGDPPPWEDQPAPGSGSGEH